MYGWWNTNNKHRYWRTYGGDIAIRKWFGKKADEKPLTGHHLGVYGQLFTYDFEWGGKGHMGGQPGGTLWDEMNYAAGVEYGYSLPIAYRLNLDFTIGVGYWGGNTTNTPRWTGTMCGKRPETATGSDRPRQKSHWYGCSDGETAITGKEA